MIANFKHIKVTSLFLKISAFKLIFKNLRLRGNRKSALVLLHQVFGIMKVCFRIDTVIVQESTRLLRVSVCFWGYRPI